MKNIYIFSGLVLLLTLFFITCEDTNENLVKQRGVGVVPNISNIEPAFFTTDLNNTFIQFNMSLSEGESVDAAEVYVTFKDKTVFLQSIPSLPAKIKLTAKEAMTKLGLTDKDVDVEKNNEFIFTILTTSNGVTTRSNNGTIKVLVTCEFDPTMAVGKYHVKSSDWDTEGDVTLTADPDNPYKIYVSGIFEMETGESNDNKLELNISPTSFAVSGPTSLIGLTDPSGKYTNYSYTPTQGIYRSCTGEFEMQFRITVQEGVFGVYNFKFTRK